MAKDDLKRLFYRNETTFSFKKYLIKIKQTFKVMDHYTATLYEKDKVRHLLDDINFPNNNFKTEFNIFRSIHSDSFETTST